MNRQNLSDSQIENFVRDRWPPPGLLPQKLLASPAPSSQHLEFATNRRDIFCLNNRPFHPTSAFRPAFALHPFIPIPLRSAFTLIELMAATTVLSVILLMMVGMQDQMSRAWSNANRRTDATREGRAAAILMAEDLSFPIFRGPTNYSKHLHDELAYSVTNKPLPFLYSSKGQNLGISIANLQSGSSCLFFVSTQRPRSTNNSDLGLIGYYVAQDINKNANGFSVTNYNLHRYYRPASMAAANLSSWFASAMTTNTIGLLFDNVSPITDDILARNVANLTILFYNETTAGTEGIMVDGINYTNITGAGGLSASYRANKMQVSLTLYPDDVAQKFTSLADWANSTNIQKFSRSFEFRVDCARD